LVISWQLTGEGVIMIVKTITVPLEGRTYFSKEEVQALKLADSVRKKILQVAADMQEFDNDHLGMYDENRAPGEVFVKGSFFNLDHVEGTLKFDVKKGKIEWDKEFVRDTYTSLIFLDVVTENKSEDDPKAGEYQEILTFTRKKGFLGFGNEVEIFASKIKTGDDISKREIRVDRKNNTVTIIEEYPS
jgi:hypothetical protein